MEGSTTTNLSSSHLEDGAATTANSSPEESGWTQYLDDFMASHDGGSSSSSSSSSLASDAASCVLTRKGERALLQECLASRKRKKGRAFVHDDGDDDPLEDTACSSAISITPEVGDVEGSDANAGERDEYHSPSGDVERPKVKEGVATAISSSRSRRGGAAAGRGELEREGLCLGGDRP